MSSSNIVDSITQKVSENFTDQVGFLQKLVQTSSINPYTSENKRVDDPIEKDVAELIFSQLKNHKLEPKKIGASKQRFNVVASLGPQRHRRSLLFNGHMDTAFISGLTRKNFLGTVKKNKLYGLGSLDMKGSLSAYIYATKAITDLDYKLKGRLTLAFVADQESGACSKWGTSYLLSKGIKAKAVIVGEPGSETIAIGHRGGYQFKITVKGESVHTGISEWEKKKKGRNAVVDMSKIIEALSDLDIPFKSSRLFSKRQPVCTFPTLISGGRAVNSVPSECIAYGDIRLMPGNSDKQIEFLIESKLKDLKNIDYSLEKTLFVPALEVEKREEIVKVLESNASKILSNPPTVKGVGPWNDSWMYMLKGIPTIGGFGPNGGGLRTKDEWVDLSSLQDVTIVYALTIIEYLGLLE